MPFLVLMGTKVRPNGFSITFWQFSWEFVKDEVNGLY